MKKNRIFFATLFLLSFIFVYFYGGKVPYMLFSVAIVLPLTSVLYTLLVYFRFKYVQTLDKKFITKGDEVNFVFTLQNDDFLFFPYIRVQFFSSKPFFSKNFEDKCFSLTPFKTLSHKIKLQCSFRGIYDFGISAIEFEDLLGIIKLRYKILSPKSITVYPRILHLTRFYLKTNHLSDQETILINRIEDQSTVSDIRKYVYGDAIKKIHWKSSAKYGELMTKNFQSTTETNCVLILDLKSVQSLENSKLLLEDILIEALIAVIYYCLNNWVPIKILFYGEQLIDLSGKNLSNFEEIYHIISHIRFDSNVDVAEVLSIYTTGSIQRNNILIFTANLNFKLFNEIFKAKHSGYELGLMHASVNKPLPSEEKDVLEVFNNLLEIGVTTFKLNSGTDIKQVLEQL